MTVVYVLVALALVVAAGLALAVRILKQYERGVLFRLGRVRGDARGPGVIAFIPFVLNFPSGLMLYWVTTNLWTTGQGLVTRRMIPKSQPPPKRSSRTPPKDDGSAGNGAKTRQPEPKPASGQQQPVRRVKRKKKAQRR